jgi:hypothetical protein
MSDERRGIVMDETTYQTWWALHLRAVRGETLNAEEQAAYQAGLRQLHEEESIPGDISALREARAKVATLEIEHAQLQARHEELEAEIAALEPR